MIDASHQSHQVRDDNPDEANRARQCDGCIVTHVDAVMKVDVYILAFPPQPEALLDGIQQLVSPLLAHYRAAKPVSRLESLPAEVLQRHLEQIGAPPTHEEMARDQHLADRPPY